MSKQGLFNYGQDIVMAFSPPVVGCLVKKGLQKGGSRAHQDPPPPGYLLELCSMLISAIVVEEFGMTPYWFLSRTLITVGITKPSTTSTSASLETQGARDLGLNSFLMSIVGFCLGRGVTPAIFQMVGRRCSV